MHRNQKLRSIKRKFEKMKRLFCFYVEIVIHQNEKEKKKAEAGEKKSKKKKEKQILLEIKLEEKAVKQNMTVQKKKE